jgi:hypothetical protein
MANVLYGPDIQGSIARGDLDEMRDLVGKAEKHLSEVGHVSAALELLKVEIAKLEKGSTR